MRATCWKIGLQMMVGAVAFGLATLQGSALADSPTQLSVTGKAPTKVHPVTRFLTERIDFAVAVTPETVQPGQAFKLVITGKPKPGFHTYSMTMRAEGQGETQMSKLQFGAAPGFQPLQPVIESPKAVLKKTVADTWAYELEHDFTWSQDVLVLPDAKPGSNTLDFTIRLMVCDANNCWGPGPFSPLQAAVKVAGPPVPLTAELQQRLNAALAAPASDTPAPTPGSGTGTTAADTSGGLLGLILTSMAAAIAMLFTPCVFPMIPITVSFFLKQSEKKHHNALLTAGVYSLTIIAVLTLAVLVLGALIVDLANNPWMNLGLGTVLIFFALSLFGMYEIELPSGLARFTSSREGRGGFVGVFFMALTFTITSFTCTGPFLGPLLAAAQVLQLSYTELILAAFAYSATFAAPFFFLALFPRLLKTLPKSGGWLNAVKVVMGFLELAAALKFLANTDIAWNPGNPMFFNYETVLCAWIALSVACGLYLLGVFRLPHDSPVEHVGVIRMMLATIFFGLALYMAPALWRETPEGIIGQGVVAFLPPDTKPNPRELDWQMDYEAAWKDALAEGKPIFIDFTGVNCTNCRYNEKNLFTRPKVRKELEKFVRVQLYTDTVPDDSLSAAEAVKQAERNRDLLAETFQNITNPFYAIIIPDRARAPIVRSESGTERLTGASTILTRNGLIPANKIKDFEDFLRDGWREGRLALSPAEKPEPKAPTTAILTSNPKSVPGALEKTEPLPSFLSKALTEAKKSNGLVFVDFTGVYCTNCKINEKKVFPLPEVQHLLGQYALAKLYVDDVPEDLYSPEERVLIAKDPDKKKRDAEANLALEAEKFGQSAQPLYVILQPEGDNGFRELARFSGRINDVAAFVDFLKKPLQGDKSTTADSK